MGFMWPSLPNYLPTLITRAAEILAQLENEQEKEESPTVIVNEAPAVVDNAQLSFFAEESADGSEQNNIYKREEGTR